MAQPPQKPGGKGVPFRTVEQIDPAASKLQDNVSEALNRLGAQTLDDTADGKTYRKLIGVNFAHQLTASGIAANTITSGQLASSTVRVSNLAPCNQFSVYRDAAQTCPAGAYTTLFANRVLKDVGNGWNAAQGIYTIPAPGDWWFAWTAGALIVNAGRRVFSDLVVNSGVVRGGTSSSVAASAGVGNGTYLYVNALAGDRVKVNFFNDDTGAVALLVSSGDNHFSGYQVR